MAEAEGFKDSKYLYSTTSTSEEPESVDIILDRLYDLNIDLKLDRKIYDAHYYMAALGLLASYGKEAIPKRIVIPEYEAREFEYILSEINQRKDMYKFRFLSNCFKETLDELTESDYKVLTQGDGKKGNFEKGKILDLEGLKTANPAVGMSLYLAQSEIPEETWIDYVGTFLDVVQRETGRPYSPDELVKLTDLTRRTAKYVTALKELGGLCSRPAGKKETEQTLHLENFILAA